MSWLFHQDRVVAPIIGSSKPYHLDDAIKALDVSLTEEEIKELEEYYLPHPIVGAL